MTPKPRFFIVNGGMTLAFFIYANVVLDTAKAQKYVFWCEPILHDME